MESGSTNAERARAAFEAFNRGDREGLLELFDPEVEFVDAPQSVEERERSGLDGIRRWFASMDEVWEELRFEVEEMVELDDERLIVVGRVQGRGRGSGIWIDRPIATLYTLRNGRAVRFEAFGGKGEALTAAGEA